jgi:hypothetical protein
VAVPDLKPPRLATDERDTLLMMLRFQRESLVRKVTGAPSDATSPVGSGTTLLWLVRHLARAELLWVAERFAGSEVDLLSDDAVDGDTLEAAVADYREGWARVDAIVGRASLEDTCRRGEPANLRWVLTHLLAETARHAGHADILRELIDGETGR